MSKVKSFFEKYHISISIIIAAFIIGCFIMQASNALSTQLGSAIFMK